MGKKASNLLLTSKDRAGVRAWKEAQKALGVLVVRCGRIYQDGHAPCAAASKIHVTSPD